LEVPALAISSTACRERVGQGLPLWYLVPDGVVQYVAKRGLYTEANAGEVLVADPLETGPRPASPSKRLGIQIDPERKLNH
jgi:nicotinate-nucleotide adenylyltransferase